jgi:hypothetical protein
MATQIEERVRRLEFELNDLARRLKSAQNKLGQVAEEVEREGSSGGQGNRVFVRAQAVGTITATTGATLGSGTARLLQTINGARYKLQPLAQGDVTVPVVQDTGGAIPNNTYLVIAMIESRWTVIVGDCATATPAVAPDPPAGSTPGVPGSPDVPPTPPEG